MYITKFQNTIEYTYKSNFNQIYVHISIIKIQDISFNDIELDKITFLLQYRIKKITICEKVARAHILVLL